MAMEDKSEVTYVTGLATWGFLNGVINVAFTTARFLPETTQMIGEEPETKVVSADYISANLRLDLNVAMLLRDALDGIIEQQTKPKVSN
jgi:hypothetical protein